MNEAKLKPCPLCGGKAELKKIEMPRDISFGGYYYEVHCKCTRYAGAREAQEMIDYWNRRATDEKRQYI